MGDFGLRIADCGFRISNSELSGGDCRLIIADCLLPIAHCQLPIANCKLQTPKALMQNRSQHAEAFYRAQVLGVLMQKFKVPVYEPETLACIHFHGVQVFHGGNL